MATALGAASRSAMKAETIPPLVSGDRLSRAEFERRYEAMPPGLKAELIEGVVYVASPVSNSHGTPHSDAVVWLGFYRAFTPGLSSSVDGTVRLDEENEPQPDVHLRILPEFGGQSRLDEDDYVAGAPELSVEIARSTASYDLHDKFEAYRRNGVREYIVWRVDDEQIDWFVLREGRYVRLEASADNVLKSEVFPGLWLDPSALLRGDLAAVFEVIQRGIATPEHAQFVERLRAEAERRTKAALPQAEGGARP